MVPLPECPSTDQATYLVFIFYISTYRVSETVSPPMCTRYACGAHKNMKANMNTHKIQINASLKNTANMTNGNFNIKILNICLLLNNL